MKRLLMIALMLGSTLIAGEVKYICPPNGLISATLNGKDMSKEMEMDPATDAEHYTLKTNWYNQPIYIQQERRKGPLIFKNTQSKLEWLQSDMMTFETGGYEHGFDLKIKITLEKGDAPIMEQNWRVSNGVRTKNITAEMQCYKQ